VHIDQSYGEGDEDILCGTSIRAQSYSRANSRSNDTKGELFSVEVCLNWLVAQGRWWRSQSDADDEE
jgi:hypothetical protein